MMPLLVSVFLFVVTLVAGIILLVSLGALLILLLRRRIPILPLLTATPLTAGPAPALSRSITGLPTPAAGGPPLTLDLTATSGVLAAPSIRLPANVSIRMTGDLTLVAIGDLIVEGKILFPEDSPPRTLTLVSLTGTVRIQAGALIAYGGRPVATGASLSGADVLVQSNPGEHGGGVRIFGVNIDVLGKVLAQQGEAGGVAVGLGPGTKAGTRAIGGGGGTGGSILLAAYESMHFGPAAQVIGGQGGDGGQGNAQETAGGVAYALGGPGGDGGSVFLEQTQQLPGLATPSTVQVFVDLGAEIRGGSGAAGGNGFAIAGDAQGADGGIAVARGSLAGNGDTVRFGLGVEVVRLGGLIAAGNGGNNADQTTDATGGKGGAARVLNGWGGGYAWAFGGQGGKAGGAPQIPMSNGAVSSGAAGRDGGGEDAEATPGTGGAGAFFFPNGGDGAGFAQGGADAQGALPPPAESSNAAAPALSKGN
ncbi:MAG: hypothetical protein HY315_09425 [Acidobacteria bacterium]|nr:hypothetical protein [Acidobacteriota bacterium]